MAQPTAKQAALTGMDGDTMDETNETRLGYHAITTRFKENTTSHGIPHVNNAQGLFKTVFWTLISLGCLSGLIWNTVYLMEQYIAFDVDVSVTLASERNLYFPAVTFCNLNAIKLMKLNNAPTLRALTDAYTVGRRKRRDLSQYDSSSESRMKRSAGTENAAFALAEQISELVADMTYQEKVALGYEKDAMILDCQFNGITCNITSDFYQFYDPSYGNCYTYNSGKVAGVSMQKSYRSGASHGLSVVFNVDQTQYIGDLTESAGMKVLVHNANHMPFPEDQGVTVAPGELTSIGVTMVQLSRKSSPYGTCYSGNDVSLNMYAEINTAGYTSKACYLTCYQSHLINDCNCGDGKYPLSSSAFSKTNVSACKGGNPTEAACVADVQSRFQIGSLGCTCEQPCTDTDFTHSASTAIWPADAHITNVQAEYDSEPSVSHLFTNGSTDYKNNMGKVLIYYEEFNYEYIQEKIAYSLGSLISDLGGILGLYLGFSAMTILEFFELGGDLLVWLFVSRNKEKRRETPVQQINKTGYGMDSQQEGYKA